MRVSSKFGCGLALALLIPVGVADAKSSETVLAPDGTEKVLYSFDSAVNGADGFEPYAGLIKDEFGNLYGATYGGSADGGGAVFR